MAENQSEATQQGGNQQFAIQKIYIKDVSFESPNSPAMFTQEWQPEVNLDMNTNTQSLSEGVFEVVLSLTATVKNADQTAFLVEVQQAGIFSISGFAENDMGHMLGSFCPNILFPYAREAVSDLVTKGGYPPLILAPVNFDALYAQHMAQQQQAGETKASTH
ncbi:MAG: protein-export chaperone SecB [Gammaproteobacteria bacterium]|nr:protein-export chaperone SecB [Gammaproteobacteria bacterium]